VRISTAAAARRWECYVRLLDQLTLQLDTLALSQQPGVHTHASHLQLTGLAHRDPTVLEERWHPGSGRLDGLRKGLRTVRMGRA
jgi:hypothetical protein